jgi:hypothetical protein
LVKTRADRWEDEKQRTEGFGVEVAAAAAAPAAAAAVTAAAAAEAVVGDDAAAAAGLVGEGDPDEGVDVVLVGEEGAPAAAPGLAEGLVGEGGEETTGPAGGSSRTSAMVSENALDVPI